MAKHFHCSFCKHHSIVNDDSIVVKNVELSQFSKYLKPSVKIVSVTCPNAKCKELTITAEITEEDRINSRSRDVLKRVKLAGDGTIPTLPEYVPADIRRTFREAAAVAPLSGAASAALARRCLQGMVRHFFDIPDNRKGDLGAELNFVKDRISPQTWEDIQAVRGVGDIGAHMDRNVDHIVNVEPEEAELLVTLIDQLVKAWYVEKHEAETRSSDLKALLARKRALQKDAKNAARGVAADEQPAGEDPVDDDSSEIQA